MIDPLDEIRAGKIRAGDGGMGTMLQSAGLGDGGAPSCEASYFNSRGVGRYPNWRFRRSRISWLLAGNIWGTFLMTRWESRGLSVGLLPPEFPRKTPPQGVEQRTRNA